MFRQRKERKKGKPFGGLLSKKDVPKPEGGGKVKKKKKEVSKEAAEQLKVERGLSRGNDLRKRIWGEKQNGKTIGGKGLAKGG